MHQHTRIWSPLFGAILATTAFAACADPLEPNEETNPELQGSLSITNPDGTTTTTVNSTVEDSWIYFHFDSSTNVDPAAPQDSNEWDLAFQRFKVKSNGGISGTGGVQIAVIPDGDFDALERAPIAPYHKDQEDSDDEDQVPDYVFLGSNPWFTYDPAAHALTPASIVYVVRTVDDTYVKLQMLSYYDSAGTPGYPQFQWATLLPPEASADSTH